MSHALYFYFPLTPSDLERFVSDHQEAFNEFLHDSFSDEELSLFESQLDSLAAVFVQPILSELSFDDFYASELQFDAQKFFFDSCQSSICFENLPDFDRNPFQVSYLRQLLSKFSEVLVDKGGVEEILFKEAYLEELRGYKDAEAFISPVVVPLKEVKGTIPVSPIDFLIADTYKEIDRLKGLGLLPRASQKVLELSDKVIKVFQIMQDQKLDGNDLFIQSRLIPKDFDDGLERLKFFLKKIK